MFGFPIPRRHSRWLFLPCLLSSMVLVACLFGVLGCGGQSCLLPGRSVTFTTKDGVTLSGKVFGAGQRGVVLAHMNGRDQTGWYGVAAELAEAGYLVLTFDFRGYGTSSGARGAAGMVEDVRAAVAEMKQQGARAVVVVGASMGGTAAIVEAADDELAGVVALSAPLTFQGLDAEPYVSKVAAPQLFLASEEEQGAADTQKLFQLANEPKHIALVLGGDHGSDILKGPGAAMAKETLMPFLRDCLGE